MLTYGQCLPATDGTVSPIDALLIINALNETASKTVREAGLRSDGELVQACWPKQWKVNGFDGKGAEAESGLSFTLILAPGDMNGDGMVDAADYAVWTETRAAGDWDGDGRVDPDDILTWMAGGMTGDWNRDGVVDAADYTVWRDALGDAAPEGGAIGGFAAPDGAEPLAMLLPAVQQVREAARRANGEAEEEDAFFFAALDVDGDGEIDAAALWAAPAGDAGAMAKALAEAFEPLGAGGKGPGDLYFGEIDAAAGDSVPTESITLNYEPIQHDY